MSRGLFRMAPYFRSLSPVVEQRATHGPEKVRLNLDPYYMLSFLRGRGERSDMLSLKLMWICTVGLGKPEFLSDITLVLRVSVFLFACCAPAIIRYYFSRGLLHHGAWWSHRR